MEDWFNRLVVNTLNWLPNLGIALLILVGSLYLANLISKVMNRALRKREVGTEITLLLIQLTRWAIVIAGMLTALQRFFDITAFLAGLGILGFTVGFALQNIMQNFTAGVILLIQQPFKVGDAVEVNNYGGNVLTINLRTTEMRTWDGRIVIIPNAEIIGNVIINYTRADRRRIEVPVGVDYTTDLEKARATILEALPAVPGFIDEPAPAVVSNTFGDSAINLMTYFWVDTAQTGLFDAKDAGVRVIKNALSDRQIAIPFPIRTVYLQKSD